ncbi:hypothetical protein ABZP36_012449 [Zizania latifolia]
MVQPYEIQTMVPVRRRPAAAAAAAVHPKRLKRPAGAEPAGLRALDEDDGLPLCDEILLLIMSLVPDTADLVRCAATCRRCRRLVSSDAAFVCQGSTPRPRSDRFIRPLAIGYYKMNITAAPLEEPRFVPLRSNSRRRQPLLVDLVDDDGRQILDASSRVVASRNGLLVAEIGRTKSGCVLKLCVCNPMSGEVDILPHLRGRDSPGSYACALLTVDDLHDLYNCGEDTTPPSSPSSYRLVLIYNRRSFTAVRCFSSDTGLWEPAEAPVVGAKVGRMRPHAAIIHRGVVFWPRLKFALWWLPTATNADVVKGISMHASFAREQSLLGLLPDGRLCWVQVVNGDKIRVFFLEQAAADNLSLRVDDGIFEGCWAWQRTIRLSEVMPESSPVMAVKLRWFYERSGVVLFTAERSRRFVYEERCYTLNLDTMEVEKANGGEPVDGDTDMLGYEIDQLAFLASLGTSAS